MLDRKNIPIYNEILKYIEKDFVNLHMPGHKMGAALEESFKKKLYQFDQTEIEGLDNLHFPLLIDTYNCPPVKRHFISLNN